jgi:hypothetical protein
VPTCSCRSILPRGVSRCWNCGSTVYQDWERALIPFLIGCAVPPLGVAFAIAGALNPEPERKREVPFYIGGSVFAVVAFLVALGLCFLVVTAGLRH